MSDSNNGGQQVTTSTAPSGDGGQNQQPGGSAPAEAPAQTQSTGDANPSNQAGNQQPNESGPFATFPDADSFNRRMQREADKRMNEAVKAAGFDSWEQMNERLTAIQNAVNPQTQTGAVNSDRGQSGSGDGPNLQMALQVAQEKNLPVALISRLQGGTKEEMAADADALLALVGASASSPPSPPAGPGIPNAPTGDSQAVTFTRAQLQDPAFVRENAAAIRQAASDGRIVDS